MPEMTMIEAVRMALARALARSVDLQFRRVQFTSDLLPSDVLGVAVHDAGRGEFVFKPSNSLFKLFF